MSPFAVVAKWFAPSHFIRPFLLCHERTNWEHTLPIMVILFTYKVYGAFLCNGFFHLFQYIYMYSSYCLVLIFSDSIQLRVGTHILLYFLQWSAQYPPRKSWGKFATAKCTRATYPPTLSKVENWSKRLAAASHFSSASPPFQRRKKKQCQISELFSC